MSDYPWVLSSLHVEPLLRARTAGRATATTSLDLGLSQGPGIGVDSGEGDAGQVLATEVPRHVAAGIAHADHFDRDAAGKVGRFGKCVRGGCHK